MSDGCERVSSGHPAILAASLSQDILENQYPTSQSHTLMQINQEIYSTASQQCCLTDNGNHHTTELFSTDGKKARWLTRQHIPNNKLTMAKLAHFIVSDIKYKHGGFA